MYAVEHNGYNGWLTTQQLRDLAAAMPEDGDYQPDSPEAEFITGYNTDSYADDSCDILRDNWDSYLEDCEEFDRTPTVDGYLDKLWDTWEYQLCHTWFRVTNLHTLDDQQVTDVARDCDRGMILQWLEDGELAPLPCAS